jgi:large subunit ribosomal protein L30
VARVAKKTAKSAVVEQKLKLTLLKSKFGRTPGHAQCLSGLGLRNRHQSVVVTATPENRGMIDKVRYLLKVEEA